MLDNSKCPKCHSRYTDTNYHTPKMAHDFDCKIGDRHVHNRCHTCKFEWFTDLGLNPKPENAETMMQAAFPAVTK